MKRKIPYLLFLFLFIAIGLCACSSDDKEEETPETTANPLIGAWLYEEGEDKSVSFVTCYYVFSKDGTVNQQIYITNYGKRSDVENQNGKWYASNNSGRITWNANNNTVNFSYKIVGDTLYANLDNIADKYIRVK